MRCVAMGVLVAAVMVCCVTVGVSADDTTPFRPLPNTLLKTLVTLADIHEEDKFADLGSGDGRVVIHVATTVGIAAHGVEIRAQMTDLARTRAKQQGATTATFSTGDLFDHALDDYTIVFLYLVPTALEKLQERLFESLPTHARIVTYAYPFPDRIADEVFETHHDGHATSLYMYWVEPMPVPTPGGTDLPLWKQFDRKGKHTAVHPFASVDNRVQGLVTTLVEGSRVTGMSFKLFNEPTVTAPFRVILWEKDHPDHPHNDDTDGIKQPLFSGYWQSPLPMTRAAFDLAKIDAKKKLTLPVTLDVEVRSAPFPRKLYFSYELKGLDKIKDGTYDVVPHNASLGVSFVISLRKNVLGWWVVRDAPMPPVQFRVYQDGNLVVEEFDQTGTARGVGHNRIYDKLDRVPDERVVLSAAFFEIPRNHDAIAFVDDWAALVERVTQRTGRASVSEDIDTSQRSVHLELAHSHTHHEETHNPLALWIRRRGGDTMPPMKNVQIQCVDGAGRTVHVEELRGSVGMERVEIKWPGEAHARVEQNMLEIHIYYNV